MKNRFWKVPLHLGLLTLSGAGFGVGVEPFERSVRSVLAQEASQDIEQSTTGRLSEQSQTLSDDSYYNPHTFTADVGQSLLIEMVSDEFDTYLLLIDPDGNEIARNDDGENGTNAQIAITIPTTGEYTILANSYEAGETGAYSITIRPTTPEVVQRAEIKAEADRLFVLGLEQHNSNQFREALISWEAALQIYREVGDRQSEADSIAVLGEAHYNLSEYQKAIEYFERALTIFREIGDRQGEGDILGNLGNIYDDFGEYQIAIDYHKQSIAIDHELGNRRGEAFSLNNLGGVYNNLGDYQTAINYHEQALLIFREIGNRDGEGAALGNLGNSYQSLGQYGIAIDYHEQHLTITRETNNRAKEANALNNLGIAYNSLAQYQKAIEYFEQALLVFREISSRDGEGVVLGNLGTVYDNLGQYQTAIDFYEQNLEIARAIGNRNGEASALGNLGVVYNNLGQYQTAIDFHEQALAILQEIGDRQGEANALGSLGNAYDNLGQYQTAIDYYEQALVINQDIGNRAGEGAMLGNIGGSHNSLGEYQISIDYYEQSLSITRDIGDRLDEGNALNNLGAIYINLGQYSTGIDYYEQALMIVRDISDRAGEGRLLGNFGVAYQYLGDYQRAIDYYEQSLEIAREIGNRQGERDTLNNLGAAYDDLNQYEKAIEHYEQSLAIAQEIGDRQGEGSTLGNLGSTYYKLDEYQLSINYHEQNLVIAREIGDRKGEGNSLNNLGAAYYGLGNYELALDFYEQGLAIFQQIGDVSGEGRALRNLGEVYQERGQDNLAITFLKASVSVRERIRSGLQPLPQDLQQSYTDTIASTYRTLADLLLERSEILEAQYVLELLKIEELEDYTRSRVTSVADRTYELSSVEDDVIDAHGSLVALERDEQQCRTNPDCTDWDWNTMDQRIQDLEIEFKNAVDALQAAYADQREDEDYVLHPNRFTGTAAEIVAIPGTVLIYPVVLEEKLWILWGTSGVSNAIEVPVSQGEIGDAVLQFRQLMDVCESRACTAEDIAHIQATAQTLYSYLIPPQLEQELAALQETLPDGQVPNLVFALDRVTRYVPMAALFDGEQYLVENYTVSTVLAAETFSQDNPLRAVTDPQVLALGLSEAVPDLGFPYPLSNVPIELNAIVGDLYPGLVLLNNEFTADAFRQREIYHILHIATHGVFEPNQQDASFLMAGSGEPITIDELKEYKSRFNEFSLVVLSACESALSKPDQSGLEIASIASVFMDAKVDTVIASLWQVNDISTSQLMQQFYGALATRESDTTISQALREAQRQMISGEIASDPILSQRGIGVERTDQTVQQPDYAHPYYWAPFVIIGNGL